MQEDDRRAYIEEPEREGCAMSCIALVIFLMFVFALIGVLAAIIIDIRTGWHRT